MNIYDNEVVTAVIKASPHYWEKMISKLDLILHQLRWIFVLNCITITTIVLVSVI